MTAPRARHLFPVSSSSLSADSLRDLVAAQSAIARASPDLETVIELVAAYAHELTFADGSMVQLLDGEDLVFRAASGVSSVHIGNRISTTGTLSGLALRSGSAQLSSDAATDVRVDSAVAARYGVTSMVAVPLVHAGTAIGVLQVSAQRPAAFTAATTDVLSMLGEFVGTAIAHAGLITERDHALVDQHDALVALTANEERHRLVVRNLPGVVVCVYDRDLWIREVRGIRPELDGRPEHELVGRHLSDFITGADYERISRLLGDALLGDPQRFEHRASTGAISQVDATPLRTEDGRIEGVLSTWRDVTAEVLEREARLAAEGRLQDILAFAPDAFVAFDGDGLVQEWNRAAERMLGRWRKDVIGQNLADLAIPPSGRAAHDERLAQAARGDFSAFARPIELTMHHADGDEVPVEVSFGQATSAEGPMYTAFLRDISQRRAAAAELAFIHARTQAVIDHSPSSIYLRDLDSRFILLNDQAAATVGHAREDVVGRTLAELWPPDVAARLKAHDDTVIAGGAPQTFEERMANGTDGVVRTWMSTKFPVRNAEGEIVALGGISHDITDRSHDQEILAAAESRFRALFEKAPVGTCVRALDGPDGGRLTQVNAALADLLGYTVEEMTGMDVSLLTAPEDLAQSVQAAQELVSGATDRVSLEKRYLHRDGHAISCLVTGTRVHGEDGHLVAISQIIDITENKRADAELREAEELFRSAFDEAALGVVLTAHDGTIVRVNPSFSAIVGRPERELLGQRMARMMHRDARAEAISSLEQLWSGEIDRIEVERHYVHASGADLWLAVNCVCLFDDDGKPRHYLAQFQDVTERVNTEHALREAEQRFHTAFDHAPIGVVVLRLDGERSGSWEQVNPAFAKMLGRSVPEMLAGRPVDFTHPDDVESTQAALRALIDDDAEGVEFEKRFIHRSGETVWALVSSARLPGSSSGQLAVTQIVDISERKRYEAQLRRLADHDPLTGLANRRRLEEELEREMARVARHGGDGALLVIDLDGFKRVNDTLGHAVGDALLSQLAGALSAALRTNDLIARIGGDEFAIVLPETDEAGALAVVEKLLSVVRSEGRISSARGTAAVSASIGITTFDNTRRAAPEELLIQADMAMYEAKQSGKDRGAVHPGAQAA